jgi:glycosyltransferase involved in cell wall biosynthesis
MCRELNVGGSERQLTELAKGLDRSRFQPHVGCFHASGFRARELEAAGVPIVRIPVRSFRSPSTLPAARQLGHYITQHNIVLVHTFDVPMNLFGVPVARLFGAPIVVSSQRAHRSLTPGLRRHLLRLTDLLVDAIVVNSQAMQQSLIEEDRVSANLIHLCYNGIDTNQFQPEPRRRQPAVADASLVIGIVCVLRPEKGLHTLLEAFAHTRQSWPGLKLAIVGSGPLWDSLQKTARRLGIAGDCHFEPAVSEVAEWLRSIDIFILPSLSEALSNSLMEAMACGCCAVASCIGGNPELVVDGKTGLLFAPSDADSLAAKLQLLIEQEDLRRHLAAAGAISIRERFEQLLDRLTLVHSTRYSDY